VLQAIFNATAIRSMIGGVESLECLDYTSCKEPNRAKELCSDFLKVQGLFHQARIDLK
jgi:hypothetical protein